MQTAFSNCARWITTNDHPRGNVFRHDGAGAGNSPLADSDSWTDKTSRADPSLILDSNGCATELHVSISHIVRSRTQETVLRNCGVLAYENWSHAIAIDVVRQTSIFSQRQVPGRPDPRRWKYLCATPDARAKQSQNLPTPTVTKPRRRAIEAQPTNSPNNPRQLVPIGVWAWTTIWVDAHSKIRGIVANRWQFRRISFVQHSCCQLRVSRAPDKTCLPLNEVADKPSTITHIIGPQGRGKGLASSWAMKACRSSTAANCHMI